MSFDATGAGDLDDQNAWTSATEPTTGTVAEKERLVREILTLQGSMSALQERLTNVQRQCASAESENEMLQSYIDGITKNMKTKP